MVYLIESPQDLILWRFVGGGLKLRGPTVYEPRQHFYLCLCLVLFLLAEESTGARAGEARDPLYECHILRHL
ncbi:hypothetical protein [Candidatus Methylomirabilis sp.]|uniref:hypothetical protein n=1 Tax=Candidatus Methylomirabilis sp. TaxID=2032687 RepID=UPI003076313E